MIDIPLEKLLEEKELGETLQFLSVPSEPGGLKAQDRVSTGSGK